MELRTIEQRNREEREDADRQKKELFKLPQFREVEARIYETHESEVPKIENFLTKNQSKQRQEDIMLEKRAIRQEIEAKMEEARYYADQPPSPRKYTVPKANDVAKLAPRSNVDFVTRNRVKAQTMIGGSVREEDDGPSVHKSFGKVPAYLENRKAKWAEEQDEIRRSAPDPECPKGMMKMPEEERTSTLDTLLRSKEEALRQLNQMPFTLETPSLRRKQADLESKLREIEHAIALFSRPKVYIAIDR